MISKSRLKTEANKGQMCPMRMQASWDARGQRRARSCLKRMPRLEASAPRGQDGRPARRRQLAREQRGRRDVVGRRRVGRRCRRGARPSGAELLLRCWARGAREGRGCPCGGGGGVSTSVEDDRRPEDAGAGGERAELPRRAEGGGGGGGDAEGGGEGARRGKAHRGVREGGLRERRGDGQRRGGERVPRGAVRRQQLRRQGEGRARRVGEEGDTRRSRLVSLQVGQRRRELRRLNRDGPDRARAIDAVLQLLVPNL
mmetsp:Transcript_31722/g.74952  ORF Transcript_31722/g.74952 Transcript_31722/m.74952 type:complete len:257 (-) Transcript_31722:640-1410(-)